MIARLTAFAAGIGLLYAQMIAERNPLVQLSGSVRALMKRVSPAVVEIIVTGYGAVDEDRGHRVNVITRQRSSGSGVVVFA